MTKTTIFSAANLSPLQLLYVFGHRFATFPASALPHIWFRFEIHHHALFQLTKDRLDEETTYHKNDTKKSLVTKTTKGKP